MQPLSLLHRICVFSLAAVLIAGCSGKSSGVVPSGPSRLPSDTVMASPGDTVMASPGDTIMASPGDTIMASPGDTIMASPGDTVMASPGIVTFALTGNSRPLCAQPVAPGQSACLVHQNVDIVPVPNAQADPLTIKGYQPKDLQAIYHLNAAGGGTVAIVDAFDNPSVEADLAIYRSTFGLPACTTLNGCFRKVNQSGASGAYPVANTAWGAEIALDVEMVSAICPACHILLVEANSASIDDLGASVDTAVAAGANAVSNSYAAPEWSGETAEESHYTHTGVPITASSGDSGRGATYPAASPHVTGVGGTVVTGSAGAYTENRAWNKAGYGCSAYFYRPHWQYPYCHGREIPDVSAIADPASGVAVYDTFVDSGQLGGWQVFGGTSVGAPIIASIYAIAHDYGAAAAGWGVYAKQAQLHPVGAAGYHFGSGLGSPNGAGAF